MNVKIKHSISFIITFGFCLLCYDLLFQQSKILSGLHSEYNENLGMVPRKNFDSFFFNEGFGIIYNTNENFITYNPGQKEIWNFYGDSFVEAQQVFSRHHFANQLSKNRKVSIRNMGQSSMNLESMFARYFLTKDKFPAKKHVFFISSDDLTTDNIGHFLALPKFNSKNELTDSAFFSSKKSLKQTIEFSLDNSGLLMLAKSDIRQIQSGNAAQILFDKFYFNNHENELMQPDPIFETRVSAMINKLSDEENLIFVFRGKEDLSNQYYRLLNSSDINLLNLQEYLKEQSESLDFNFYKHQVSGTIGHWNRKGHKAVYEYLKHEL